MVQYTQIDIDVISKILLIVTSLLSIILVIKNDFTVIYKKQKLKRELEILNLLNGTGIDNEILCSAIKKDLISIYTKSPKNTNFTLYVIPLVLFIGFGLWTLEIYKQDGFNPWILLTLFLSLIGVSMALSKPISKMKNNDKPFVKIGFYIKPIFFGLFLIFFSGIIILILLKYSIIWILIPFAILLCYGCYVIIARGIRRIE